MSTMNRTTPWPRYQVKYFCHKRGKLWSVVCSTRLAAVAFAEGKFAFGRPAVVEELPAKAGVLGVVR